MDALRPSLLPLLCLLCLPPTFILFSCPFLGHWPVVLGMEELADSSGRDEAGLEPSVYESAQLWRSCQLEATQQHLEYVLQGHCTTEGEGGCQDQTDLALGPGTATQQLCDLGQATRLL